MAVNVKMGVDIGGFTAGIKQGQQILKGLNAEMKATDAEFKATGNAEQKMAQQTKTLNSQLNVQKGIFDQAQQALKKMEEAGIKPTDAAYQKMYATMMNAKAGMNDAQAALNNLGTGAESAAGKADKLTNSINGISKKISLDQVISGVNTITKGLESAAQKAIQLGQNLFDAIMDSARRADDTATLAEMYGIDLTKFQQMQMLVTGGMDTTVDNMLASMTKLRKGIGSDTQAVLSVLDDLHVQTKVLSGDEGVGEYMTRDQMELFWEAGRAIYEMKDAYEQEAAAQTLFGKSWRDLSNLFKTYSSLDEYNAALDQQTVNSEDTIRNLAELNDAVSKLEGSWTVLKDELIGGLAPALTAASDALSGLINSITEYLQTDEGQAMLKDLQTAVTDLFSGMKNINAEDIVNNFKEGFDKVTGALQWVVDNKDTVLGAIEAVFGFWATFKVGSGVTTLLKLFDGAKGLFGGRGGTGSAGGGGGGGTSLIGGGGWLTAMSNWLNQGVSNIASGLTQFTTQGGGFILDWLTHESPLGSIFQGTESLGDWWNRQVAEFNQRQETFDQDWRENKLFGWAVELGENSIRFWDNFWNGGGSKEELQSQADDFLKTMGLAVEDGNPVDVPAEMIPEEDSAEKISAMVGVVPIQAELVGVSGGGSMGMFRGMPTGGAGGGGLPHYKLGNANGLPYVPNDGLYLLHRGERVTPARELASRNFSSNLYVENMNMSGGMDAAGLAAAMAAAQRRAMAAYGS